MNDISVGAVGAAFVAGFISLISLIISKENKISDFRQAWIDELRKCLIAYLASINAISDTIRSQKTGDQKDNSTLIANYKALNEASNGITLRLNVKEAPSKALLSSMKDFENLADSNSTLTPEKIKDVEEKFLKSSRKLLKFEWDRVKRGEKVFFFTKWFLYAALIATALFTSYFILSRSNFFSASKCPGVVSCVV